MKKQDYYFKCSGGLILFVGHPDIKSESFLYLNPGDRIIKVGETFNKKNIGSPTLNRVDDFRPYITYVGTRIESHIGDTPKEMILFQCRKEDTPEIVDPADNFYIGYIVIRVGDTIELKTYDPKRQTFRIYRPEFTFFNEEEFNPIAIKNKNSAQLRLF